MTNQPVQIGRKECLSLFQKGLLYDDIYQRLGNIREDQFDRVGIQAIRFLCVQVVYITARKVVPGKKVKPIPSCIFSLATTYLLV